MYRCKYPLLRSINMLEVHQLVEGEVSAIAFGGDGVMRYHGLVIFVPFTVIGDRISCRIIEKKNSFAKGLLVQIKRASPHRIAPRCPYFGTCGGCQLQHMDAQMQSEYKITTVQDALQRIGHLIFPPIQYVRAKHEWAYRRHITLHLKSKHQTFAMGYIGHDQRSLICISTCPIFNASEQTMLAELQNCIQQLANPNHAEGRLTILKIDHDKLILSFQFDHRMSIDRIYFQKAMQQLSCVAGIFVKTTRDQFHIGQVHGTQTIDGLTVHFSPQTFIQNHLEQSLNIARQICQFASACRPTHILDLYCGYGLTTLLLAKQGHLATGMEINPEATRFARYNQKVNCLHCAQFITGNVEKLLPRWLKKHQTDFVIVNPPRAGLTPQLIAALLHAQPQHILYISCMPATLARDLSHLCRTTYRIHTCQVYDMFPQTAHVETLVYCNNSSAATQDRV